MLRNLSYLERSFFILTMARGIVLWALFPYWSLLFRGAGGDPRADQNFHSDLMELRCLIDISGTLLPGRADLVSSPHSRPRSEYTLLYPLKERNSSRQGTGEPSVFISALLTLTVPVYCSTPLYLQGQGFKSWTVDLSS
jgi:hypothetical protein